MRKIKTRCRAAEAFLSKGSRCLDIPGTQPPTKSNADIPVGCFPVTEGRVHRRDRVASRREGSSTVVHDRTVIVGAYVLTGHGVVYLEVVGTVAAAVRCAYVVEVNQDVVIPILAGLLVPMPESVTDAM